MATAPKKETIITAMAFERETKGAVRYYELDEHGKKRESGYVIGTLYLRKDELATPYPQVINIAISWEK